MVQQSKDRRVLRPAEQTPDDADARTSCAEPSPAEWTGFAKSLTGGDAAKVRRFLADNNLPAELGAVLAVVLEEEKRLAGILGTPADDPTTVEQLERELALARQMRPSTAEAVTATATLLGNLDKRVQTAKVQQVNHEHWARQLDAMRMVFRELFDGTPGELCPSNAQLPTKVANTLAKAGFDRSLLWHERWTTAFQKMVVWPG